MENEQIGFWPKIIDVDIEKEMKKSFLDYSMTVIISRALPDVRDGLKPVHRRILYTLFEDGLTPDKAYRKCANTVGSVLGRYHPHGEASVYDALVRLAQPFSLRYMLVDGHGNFGSIDGDPPAAYRYTESRMSKIAVEMLTDIDKETVNFLPNYDDRLKEPTVLPSKFPNILVNGSTGIAVGMATNIPPHNLNEVIDAMCLLIDNPSATISDLMAYIKGPDFPTAALIIGKTGIKEAYSTGKGKITVRAKTEIVEEKNKVKIIVSELPYQVNKARLIENIAEMIKEKRLESLASIEDHSDRKGIHVEIVLKKDASAKIALNRLFSFTQLQVSFNVMMLAIVDGEPKILTLKDLLEKYINFQIEVITKRTRFELRKALERAHVLSGLQIALDNIDEVISILRAAKSISNGRTNLSKRFELDEIQTQAIVQMPLGRLTGLERGKLEKELLILLKKAEDLKDILDKKEKILAIIKTEALEIKRKFGDERRTKIEIDEEDMNIEDLIPNEKSVLTLTSLGYVKRQNINTYKLQRRGGRGVSGMTRREEDAANEMFVINLHDFVLFFTNLGKVYKLKCHEIPEGSRISKGLHIVNLLPLFENERVTSMIKVTEFTENNFLIMVTKFGVIKRVALKVFSNCRKKGIIALDLDEADELVWVRMTNGFQDVILATKKGKAIRFKEETIRAVGRTARGVRAIRLVKKDVVAGMIVINKENNENEKILTISETGYGRISDAEEYRCQSRGGLGVINYHIKKYGDVASLNIVMPQDDVIIISADGAVIRIASETIRKTSRVSKGVRVMKIVGENKIVAVACVMRDDAIEKN